MCGNNMDFFIYFENFAILHKYVKGHMSGMISLCSYYSPFYVDRLRFAECQNAVVTPTYAVSSSRWRATSSAKEPFCAISSS